MEGGPLFDAGFTGPEGVKGVVGPQGSDVLARAESRDCYWYRTTVADSTIGFGIGLVLNNCLRVIVLLFTMWRTR
jgi:hypothetical protein